MIRRLLATCGLIATIWVAPAAAQQPLPAAVAATVARYEDAKGLPGLSADAARAWTRALCEQIAFEHPGQGWGHKSAGGGRPPSTDVIARQWAGVLDGWDLILNQGVPQQSFITSPLSMSLAGQLFIPVVGQNHLGTAPPPTPLPTPTPVPAPPPVNLQPILDALAVLTAKIDAVAGVAVEARDAAHAARAEAEQAKVNASDLLHQPPPAPPLFPCLSGQVWGRTSRFCPSE